MKRGFWNGVLTGGVLGAIIGAVMTGKTGPKAKRSMMTAGKVLGRRAGRLIASTGARVGEAIERRMRH